MIKTVLNFGGFYDTWHSQRLDDVIALCTQDDNEQPLEDAPEYDYHQMSNIYSQQYVKFCNQELSINLVFQRLSSPREYNFHTDKIHVDINDADIKKVWQFIIDNDLTEKLYEHITYWTQSHPGFVPSYSYNFFVADEELLTEAVLDIIINQYLDNQNQDYYERKWVDYYDNQNIAEKLMF